jgi:serine/threonine protein phosphatase PrpC
LQSSQDATKALKDAFIQTDELITPKLKAAKNSSGSTAVVAFVTDKYDQDSTNGKKDEADEDDSSDDDESIDYQTLYVANVGDSRAVLW